MFDTLGCSSDLLFHLPSKLRALEAPKKPQLFSRSTPYMTCQPQRLLRPKPPYPPP